MRIAASLLLLALLSTYISASQERCPASYIASPAAMEWLEEALLPLGPYAVNAIMDSTAEIETGSRAPFFSRTPIWLRITVENPSSEPCFPILRVGDPRIEDIRVYQRVKGNWLSQVSGSRHPAGEWAMPSRFPDFPVRLEANQRVQLLIRVESQTQIALRPEFFNENAYQKVLDARNLKEGIMIGAILIIIPLGFVVSYVLRSLPMAVVSAILMFYFPITLIVNGYLLYAPAMMRWTIDLLATLNVVGLVLWYWYLYLLFKVKQLSSVMVFAFFAYFSVGLIVVLMALFYDFGQYSPWFLAYREYSYAIYIALLFSAWRNQVALSWLARLLGGFLIVQGALLHVFSVNDSALSYADSNISIFSNTLMIIILSATMVSAIISSRRRAERMKREIQESRQNERIRLENMVSLRTEQLSKSLDSRTYMLASISHDLRSPIASIVHKARSLQGEHLSDGARDIERQAQLHLDMLDELLTLARDDFQRLRLTQEVGYSRAFFEQVADNARQLAISNNNRFSLNVSDELPPLVKADFQQLRRILTNLLDNANKFTQDGHFSLTVEVVETLDDHTQILCRVCDSGSGIDASQRAHIMAPFQRGENQTAAPGYGLGLSIVQELLALMDSHLSVRQAPEGGACFEFTVALPLAHELEVEEYFIERYEQGVSGAGWRILLVDDEPMITDHIAQLLQGYEFDVLAAQSVDQALDLLRHESIDVIVTDQALKDSDGFALLFEARTHWPDIPVMLYSAMPPKLQQAAKYRFDAVLLKPAETDHFLHSVVMLCQRHGRSQKVHSV